MQADAVAVHLSHALDNVLYITKANTYHVFPPTCYLPPITVPMMSCVGHFMVLMFMMLMFII